MWHKNYRQEIKVKHKKIFYLFLDFSNSQNEYLNAFKSQMKFVAFLPRRKP